MIIPNVPSVIISGTGQTGTNKAQHRGGKWVNIYFEQNIAQRGERESCGIWNSQCILFQNPLWLSKPRTATRTTQISNDG